MGFGTKCDFTKGDLNKPGPDRYSVISVFSQDNSKKRGCTFSLGRDVKQLHNRFKIHLKIKVFIAFQLCILT